MTTPHKGYGALRPYSAPVKVRQHVPNPEPHSHVEDVRHTSEVHDINAPPPMPWLRYFFPQDFAVREGQEQLPPFQQFFDVHVNAPLEHDSAVPPPPWAPNAFFRLSFTQAQFDPTKSVDVPGRQPNMASPLLAASDITDGNRPLFREGAEKHLKQVMDFSRHVAGFKPRVWKDALPLVDLLRGVLLYLLGHMEEGVKLAREYATRDALAAQEADRKLVREQAAAELARTREQWDTEAAASAAALKEQLRKQLADELAGQMRSLNEERERWAQKAAAGEAAIKKLQESEAQLERHVAALESQLEAQKADSERLLAAARAEAAEAATEAQSAHEGLLAARDCILSALQARTRQEVVQVAVEAVASTMPGAAAYVSEVATAASAAKGASASDGSLALSTLTQAAETDESLAAALRGFGDCALLRSPTSAGVLQPTGRPSFKAIKEQSLLHFVAATPGQEFLVGTTLQWPQGVSWPAVEAGAEVHVPDVARKDGVCFLRPNGAPPSGGTYLALPIAGVDGETVGLLGIDTVAGADGGGGGGGAEAGPLQLGEEDADFLRALAKAISDAVVQDQQALATLVDQANMSASTVPSTPTASAPADPERFADLKNGKQLLKDALATLSALSDEELEAFRGMDAPSEATLAVMRAVLAAAGQVDDGTWASVRGLVTRELLERLSRLDPEGAWAEWNALCTTIQPVIVAEAHAGANLDVLLGGSNELQVDDEEGAEVLKQAQELKANSVTHALARWVAAVRKISAAKEVQRAAEAALQRANAALLRALSGEGGVGGAGGAAGGRGGEGAGSNALQELKSYRVPPRNSFAVLQAVLQLTGHSDDDCRNWGRIRVLASYKLVKQLTELKPAKVPPKVLSSIRSGIRDMDEADVRKESVAALALFRWLRNFVRCGQVLGEAAQ